MSPAAQLPRLCVTCRHCDRSQTPTICRKHLAWTDSALALVDGRVRRVPALRSYCLYQRQGGWLAAVLSDRCGRARRYWEPRA